MCREWQVRCQDDGKLEYFGNFTSYTPPESQKCIPVECNVNVINSARGKRSPMYGKVRYGETGNVTCNEGYRVKPAEEDGKPYTGANALCRHKTSFSLRCDGNTCGFPQSPTCSRVGCEGVSANRTKTTDGLEDVIFKYFGRTSDPTVHGQLQEGQFFAVTCPGDLEAAQNQTRLCWTQHKSVSALILVFGYL